MNDTHKTTEYTASVREYINSLSENELIEYGHNEFDGKDQMFAALDTIDKRLSLRQQGRAANGWYFDLSTGIPPSLYQKMEVFTMLTHMKFENRPVHLFNISGRKYYVTRSSAPQTGAVALTSTNGAAAVLAPANMSYQQAAMKAAQICLTL